MVHVRVRVCVTVQVMVGVEVPVQHGTVGVPVLVRLGVKVGLGVSEHDVASVTELLVTGAQELPNPT